MPLFELSAGKLDAKRITEGIWWSIRRDPVLGFDGERLVCKPTETPAVLVRPIGDGIEWQRALEDAQRPYRVEIREGRLSPELQRKTVAEAMARVLWRDCVNLTQGGAPFVWTEADAAKLLAAPEWLQFHEFIFRKASDRAALHAEEEAKASGN